MEPMPPDPFLLIFNPRARNGRALSWIPQVKLWFEAAGIRVDMVVTERPGHAEVLARQATHPTVISVGGDGTLHEVVNGLISARSEAILGVLPLGTGNDVVKMLGMPFQPEQAARFLLDSPVVAMDYGRVCWEDEAGEHQRAFINQVGAGFDAQVASIAPRYKKVPGVAGYLVAVLRTLGQWEGPWVRVAVEGEPRYEGPMLLITASNGRSSGGGFLLTPQASVVDGMLDLCLIENTSSRRILTLLPSVLRGGHVTAREVHLEQVRHMALRSRTPLPLHADGELLSLTATRIEAEVVPAGLRMLAPAVV